MKMGEEGVRMMVMIVMVMVRMRNRNRITNKGVMRMRMVIP